MNLRIYILLFLCAIISAQDFEVDGDLSVTGSLESTTIDSMQQVIDSLHRIKEIGLEIKRALEEGNLRRFGELLDEHWETKKRLSGKVSRDKINRWYDMAKDNGALGGKIMGAGGGGFFMFYCHNGKAKLRQAMVQEGLVEMRFRFDFEGSKILVNL